MYKVFLVDDEIVVREGIRSNFPWEDTEFQLTGEAPDGEMALSMLQDIKPDILITDIRMPFMDGLSLARAVTRTMPWMYVIILSGYDDFSYAREAIKLGVAEYLLKPVNGQELMEVLNRIAGRIREDKRQQASLRVFREQFASSRRFLKEKLLLDVFAGGNVAELKERARALQIDMQAGCYRVMLLKPVKAMDTQDERAQVEGVLYRLADLSGGTAQLCEHSGAFALLVLGDSEADIEERAYGFAQSAQYDVERNTGVKLQVSIGLCAHAMEEIPQSMRDAQAVMERMDESRAPRIMSMQDVAGSDFSLTNLELTPIAEQLRHAAVKDVDAILQHHIAGLGDGAAQSILIANYLYVDMLLAASRIIKENGGVPQEVLPSAFQAQLDGTASKSVEEVVPLMRDMLMRAIAFRDAQGSSRYGSLIRKAKGYIAERFNDPGLTLNQVAGHVALSNNHFCTVFSQEVGVTYTEYLTATRIAKAKELLTDTGMRTSDIAYAVGYNDPHYFSYLFKKNTGLSPREYRKDDKIG